MWYKPKLKLNLSTQEKAQKEVNWLLGHSLETLGISVVKKKIGYVYFFRGSINTRTEKWLCRGQSHCAMCLPTPSPGVQIRKSLNTAFSQILSHHIQTKGSTINQAIHSGPNAVSKGLLNATCYSALFFSK